MTNTKLRKSRQRDMIVEILNNTRSHPTADDIYLEMKGEFPDLSMGNVYRNLNILVDQGSIQRLDFGSTFNRFDGNCEMHSHFICEKCHSVSDVMLKEHPDLSSFINGSEDKLVKRYKLDFFGICENCRS